jgi:hypothetical protein
MGLLNQIKRVDLGDGEWADVRPLSVGQLREMRIAVATITPQEGEEKDEAMGFELSRMALEATIVAWSDEEPVTPENISRLPYKVTFIINSAIGLGDDEVPLETGSPSTSTSVDLEEKSQTIG